jgi:RNA polymerase sigma-70 factor, ECF subfamily
VIQLRDIAGLPAAEVAALLGISEANQRVRLHRARGHVRRVLEEYLR